MNKTKRPQAPKSRNEPLMRAMQELRSSNAAGPHKAKNIYNRNDKSWKVY
jgi:hypothetical protein